MQVQFRSHRVPRYPQNTLLSSNSGLPLTAKGIQRRLGFQQFAIDFNGERARDTEILGFVRLKQPKMHTHAASAASRMSCCSVIQL
jgi:hypothetical protein